MMRYAFASLLRHIAPAKKVTELNNALEIKPFILKDETPELFVFDTLVPCAKNLVLINRIKDDFPGAALVISSTTTPFQTNVDITPVGEYIFIDQSMNVSEVSKILSSLLKKTILKVNAITTGSIKLPKRQKQLIPLLDLGMSNRDISIELGISEHTVKVHLWRLFRRLNVKSRTQALHFARLNNLI